MTPVWVFIGVVVFLSFLGLISNKAEARERQRKSNAYKRAKRKRI